LEEASVVAEVSAVATVSEAEVSVAEVGRAEKSQLIDSPSQKEFSWSERQNL
jgi:hypothetical protein